MSDSLLASYEQVHYESKPIYRTHPEGMATVGTVFGMTPAPIERCRVLELGCAGGGNLLPMALALPESRFLGVDLSPGQIAAGQAAVAALGLDNLDLRALSITDFDESFGDFDYIICHGVYSWVPPAVQAKILDICGRHLTPNGIAYISYNTYPGWHQRAAIRDMLTYHTRSVSDPVARVKKARELLAFLPDAVGNDNVFGLIVKEEADLLKDQTDSYLLHEELDSDNHPLYFHEFVSRAAAHGLQFLAEAQFNPRDANLKPDVEMALSHWADDVIAREQYLDFLRDRTFRRTLLCRSHHRLNRAPTSAILQGLHLAALAKPVAPKPDIHSNTAESFHAPDGASITTNHPLVKASLISLFEVWPRAIPFETLWRRVRSRLAEGAGPYVIDEQHDPGHLADALLHCYFSNVVELHHRPPEFASVISTNPVASPLARLQAARGAKRVTNLCHRIVELDEVDRALLAHLDGSHARPELLEILLDLAARDVLALRRDGQPVRDPVAVRETLTVALDLGLRRLAASALLVS